MQSNGKNSNCEAGQIQFYHCHVLNCVLTKDTLKSLLLVLVNVTLFGNRVIADVIKMRVFRWAPTQYDWCPYKKRQAQREGDEKTETEAELCNSRGGVMQLQTNEQQGMPATGRSWQEARTDSPESQRENSPADTLNSDF